MADREKLIELLGGDMCKGCYCDECEHENNEKACIEHIKSRMADHLISHGVTVRERGRWIQHGELDEDGNGQYHCSVCSAGETHNPIVDVPYCWKCGADMRGTEDA